jgi:hypothetical protein
MQININKHFITLVIFFFLSSCKEKDKDFEYENLKNYPENQLTKIEVDQSFKNVDTIKVDSLNVVFVMKNIGSKKLNKIFVKQTCDCEVISKYKTSLNVGESQNVKIAINLEGVKGNFNKSIYLYGSFFPYVRKLQVIGFKK